MTASLRDRFAYWLERFAWLHPVLLRYSHPAPDGVRHVYTNRINGHLMLREGRDRR